MHLLAPGGLCGSKGSSATQGARGLHCPLVASAMAYFAREYDPFRAKGSSFAFAFPLHSYTTLRARCVPYLCAYKPNAQEGVRTFPSSAVPIYEIAPGSSAELGPAQTAPPTRLSFSISLGTLRRTKKRTKKMKQRISK